MALIVIKEFNVPAPKSAYKIRKVLPGTRLKKTEYDALDDKQKECVEDTEAGMPADPDADPNEGLKESTKSTGQIAQVMTDPLTEGKTFDQMTIPELRDVIKANNVEVEGKNKQALVDALRAAGVPEADATSAENGEG